MTTLPTDNQSIKALPLWRNRDFLLLLSGQGISTIGGEISQLAFPLLMLAFTRSPAQTGLVAALHGLPYALFCLPAGALVDRWNRKRIMIYCDVGRALAMTSIPIAYVMNHLTFVQLAVVALVEGTLFVFFQMADATALPHVVAKEQIATAAAQSEVLNSSSVMLGSSIGGLLYGVSNMLPFVGDALSYLVSVVSLFFIRTDFQAEREETALTIWQDVREGLLWLWRNPTLRFMAALTAGLILPCYGYALILIVLAQDLHATVQMIGFVFAGGGIGSVIGAFLTNPALKYFGLGRLIIISAWIWSLSWLFYALAPDVLLLGLLNGISFAIVPVYMVNLYSYRLATIPDQFQGRVNSVYRLITIGGQPVSMVVTGMLLQLCGPRWTVLLLFLPQLIVTIIATFNRRLRQIKTF